MDAFETFMREQGPMIYTLSVRLTGSTADGQDLAQETFVKAFENFDRFRGESSPATWVYRICINLWKNRVRYEKRRFFWKHFSLDGASGEDSPASEIADSEPSSGAQLEGLDQQQAVQKALAELTPEERAIVVLRDMEDKSYEEISDLLELPMGTVKSRLARSRERLRQILEPHMQRLI